MHSFSILLEISHQENQHIMVSVTNQTQPSYKKRGNMGAKVQTDERIRVNVSATKKRQSISVDSNHVTVYGATTQQF